jgi:hypothetical protein
MKRGVYFMSLIEDMKVKSVEESENRIVIETTGAKYIIDRSEGNGCIDCWQMINKERLVARLCFDFSFMKLSVEYKDCQKCILHVIPGNSEGAVKFQFNRDSMIDIYSLIGFGMTVMSSFLPQYHSEKDGCNLFIDDIGGFGLYPYKNMIRYESENTYTNEWNISYNLSSYGRFFVSVFPPRGYDYERSFDDRIYHRGGADHPTDEELENASRYTSVLLLHHDTIWQGKLTRKGIGIETLDDFYADASYCSYRYTPINEGKLLHTVKKAHSLNMKVLPYMSPYYSMASGNDFLSEMERILDDYDMDGIYFDGVSMDIAQTYETIKNTRKILGNRRFYIHCSIDPISTKVYCPFIDTYADYILRAESISGYSDAYLRYVISGFNISNTIGLTCYSGYPLAFMEKLVEKILSVNARLYLSSYDSKDKNIKLTEDLIINRYFPKLEKIHNSYLAGKMLQS